MLKDILQTMLKVYSMRVSTIVASVDLFWNSLLNIYCEWNHALQITLQITICYLNHCLDHPSCKLPTWFHGMVCCDNILRLEYCSCYKGRKIYLGEDGLSLLQFTWQGSLLKETMHAFWSIDFPCSPAPIVATLTVQTLYCNCSMIVLWFFSYA